MNFEELEQSIADTKNRLRVLIPKLIECRNYLKNFSNYIDMKNDPLNNEQITKDQLILPVLRELGYKTEYENGILNVWAETCLSDDTKQKVDYAIFLENCPYPRMIIEAKALNKLETKRSDYKTPTAQTSTYYNEYGERILIAVLSNGDRWVVLGRGIDTAKKKATIDPGKSEIFVLDKSESDSNNLLDLSSESGLDRFVRLLSKATLLYTLDGVKDSDVDYEKYDAYRKDLKKRIFLKQALQSVLTKVESFRNFNVFEEFYLNDNLEKLINEANERASRAGASQESIILLEEVNGSTKKERSEQEAKRKNQLSYWKGNVIALFNELNSIPAMCENSPKIVTKISVDDEKIKIIPGPIPEHISDPIPYISTTGKWKNDSKEGELTQLEMDILNKIKGICNSENILAVDNEQYITFIIADKESKIPHGTDFNRNRKRKDEKYDNPWFMQYGNIEQKDGNDPKHAQNDGMMQNACIAFYYPGRLMKDLFHGRDLLEDTELEKTAIKINALSDFDEKEIKDAIKECFDYWYDKWQGKPSN